MGLYRRGSPKTPWQFDDKFLWDGSWCWKPWSRNSTKKVFTTRDLFRPIPPIPGWMLCTGTTNSFSVNIFPGPAILWVAQEDQVPWRINTCTMLNLSQAEKWYPQCPRSEWTCQILWQIYETFERCLCRSASVRSAEEQGQGPGWPLDMHHRFYGQIKIPASTICSRKNTKEPRDQEKTWVGIHSVLDARSWCLCICHRCRTKYWCKLELGGVIIEPGQDFYKVPTKSSTLAQSFANIHWQHPQSTLAQSLQLQHLAETFLEEEFEGKLKENTKCSDWVYLFAWLHGCQCLGIPEWVLGALLLPFGNHSPICHSWTWAFVCVGHTHADVGLQLRTTLTNVSMSHIMLCLSSHI